jgi:hypothetical protein
VATAALDEVVVAHAAGDLVSSNPAIEVVTVTTDRRRS